MKTNFDGLGNVITGLTNQSTGLGVAGYDSIASVGINSNIGGLHSDRWMLEACYRSIWQCRKVCDYLPNMMRLSWGTLTLGDGDVNIIKLANKRLSSLESLYVEGQVLANLHGGSTIVRLIDDGREAWEPVDKENIRQIRYSRVYDRWEIQPDPFEYRKDPKNPELYYFYGEGGTTRIHKDRIVRFRGDYLPPDSMKDNYGWEASVLTSFLNPLFRYLPALNGVGEAMRTFELIIFYIDGLFRKAQTPEGEAEVKKRMAQNQKSMSAFRSLMADKTTESLEIIGRQFTGVHDTLDRLRDEMIGASGLTKPQFYQEHPSGLAATGESERIAEANSILSLCKKKWDDLIKCDTELYLLSQESPTKGQLPDDWDFEWKSLYSSTPTEEANIRLTIARTDALNIAKGIYSPEEARESHYGSSDFDVNITLDQKTDVNNLLTNAATVAGVPQERIDGLTIAELKKLLSKGC